MENKDDNEIKVVVGDTTELNISEVNDCINPLNPQTLSEKKKNIIIPQSKKDKKDSKK